MGQDRGRKLMEKKQAEAERWVLNKYWMDGWMDGVRLHRWMNGWWNK